MDTQDFWDRSAASLLMAAYAGGFLFAAALLVWQAIEWLRTGVWQGITTESVLAYFDVDLSAVYSPSQWFGLAKVGQWVLSLPLWFTGPLVCILAAHAWHLFVSLGTARDSA